MKPLLHAKNSARRWGGEADDYLFIHDFLDSSKAHVPDMRHRAMFHHSLGIYIAEDLFGTYFKNSEGREISVRDIAEEHIIEDMDRIPTVQDYLAEMPLYEWLGGAARKITRYPMVD